MWGRHTPPSTRKNQHIAHTNSRARLNTIGHVVLVGWNSFAYKCSSCMIF
ncbi:hypothetical protein MtrunA17_Chr1g0155641 [Medicago truncatula]|uniref:Uncharacterized protein n=1 Tax=Medicago truncatula TaxID=3880 RepID=A0A396JGY2_MEDTR|nr:hypothetical protein MtrunA17_Chr1g0155641 [Medicago truncatula]